MHVVQQQQVVCFSSGNDRQKIFNLKSNVNNSPFRVRAQ